MTTTEVEQVPHSTLGPSSAAKWMECTAAPALEATLPEEPESEYAAEGTYWHYWAEVALSAQLGHITARAAKMRLNKHRRGPEGEKFYSLDGQRHVEHYVDKVMEFVDEYAETFDYARVEFRVKLGEWIIDTDGQPAAGTADAIIVAGNVLHVIDLKMGQGVKVEAEGNPQAKLYALGVLGELGLVYDFELVRMTIIQPRLHAVSTSEVSAESLLAWGEERVRPQAIKAATGEGAEFAPSEKACRWCRAKYVCRARAEASLAEDFTDPPPTLDNAELADILTRLPAIKAWVTDVEKYTKATALSGGTFPGWKLVEGKANRKIVDADAARAAFAKMGLQVDEYLKARELKPLGDLEKLVGKEELPKLLGDALAKPAGAPTLVPEGDNRPAIHVNTAADDFAEDHVDDGEDLL